MTKCLARFEGRLFVEGGCLFLVVHADESTDQARVTCRIDGQTQVVEMPLSEVASRIAAGSGLMLDNLNSLESEKRITRGADGWYFSTREGRMGPIGSREDAARQLVRYVLSMQSVSDVRREPLRRAGYRRDDLAPPGQHGAVG